MRETLFIEQNMPRWVEFEEYLKSNEDDPEKLSKLYIQITEDLSYARTFYPNRSVRIYLNNLARQVFYRIYKNKRGNFQRFVAFWKDELPGIIYDSRKELLISFIVFITAVLVGVLSSVYDPEFSRFILGDNYVSMTLENIKNGDPMAVYKKANGMDMFLGITFNNVFIAFQSFLLGALFAVGSFVILIRNGVMVGTFQYFFYEHGFFTESLLTIWLHGTLEISSIIIAGAAGLRMGKGLIFPATYSRFQSFLITTRQGAKLLAGIVPIVIFAALIESFLTRYSDTPQVVRFSVILLSLLFVFLYFVRYPYVKAKRSSVMNFKQVQLRPIIHQKINFQKIKANGEVFKDVFLLYKKYFKNFFILSLVVAVVYSLGIYFIQSTGFSVKYRDWFFIIQFFDYNAHPLFLAVNTLLFTLVSFMTYSLIIKESDLTKPDNSSAVKDFAGKFLYFFIVLGLVNLSLMLNDSLQVILFFLVFPFILFYLFVMINERAGIIRGYKRALFLIGKNYWKLTGLFVMLTFTSVMCFFLLSSPLVFIYFEVFSLSFYMEEETSKQILLLLLSFTSILVLCLTAVVWFAGVGLFYFSAREIADAPTLRQKLSKFLE